MSPEPLPLYWWRLETHPRGNFGDELSAVLIEEIFGRRCIWSPPAQCELAAAGSIAEILLALKAGNRAALWGTGFMRDDDHDIAPHEFAVAALRGTRSRDRVQGDRGAVALGDPGLLADALLPRRPAQKFALGVLPHFLDAGVAELDWLRTQPGVRIIEPTAGPRNVVEQIAECDSLLSSSLHGLIVADSIGVPNAHIRLSGNQFIGGMHKFRDYYSVFADPSRYRHVAPAAVLEQGVEATAADLVEAYRVPADLDQIKAALVKAFPFAQRRTLSRARCAGCPPSTSRASAPCC
jgi:pyruvyltransferase